MVNGSRTKNLRSTAEAEEQVDLFPTKSPEKSYELYVSIEKDIFIAHKNKVKAYLDQTGRFPHISSQCNQYLFILYDYDCNAISAESLKSHQGKVIAEVFTKCHTELTQHGHEVKICVLHNECSNDLKLAIGKTTATFELVPPHQHCRNVVKHAIRTYMNHLLAGLATCDLEFPVTEWDRMLFQYKLT